MSAYTREARRLSEVEVPPTCKAIDAAIKDMEQVVKEKTGDLRSALESWIERALEAEDLAGEQEKELDELRAELEEIKRREVTC